MNQKCAGHPSPACGQLSCYLSSWVHKLENGAQGGDFLVWYVSLLGAIWYATLGVSGVRILSPS